MTEAPAACGGNWFIDLACLFVTLPAPILAILSLAVPIIGWFIVSEWILLGQPGNPAFQKQIDRIRARAEKAAVSEKYRDWLGSLLNGIERLFGPVSAAVPGSWSDRWFGCQPWTAISYGRLLSLAYIYIWLFLYFGIFKSKGWVLLIAVVIVGYVAGVAIKARAERVHRIWLRTSLLIVTVTVIFLIAISISGSANVDVAVVFSIAFSASVSVAFAVVLAAAVSFTAVSSSSPPTTAVVALFAFAFIMNYIQYKSASKNGLYFLTLTLTIIAIFIALIIRNDNDSFIVVLLFTLLLPAFNAPIDWLSLGMTRGLLLKISNGEHRSLSTLGWAIVDIGLALLFLIAVAASSYMAYFLAKKISPVAVISTEDLGITILGGTAMSTGLWLILASTLVPTFLHFLVALLAFVSLPFSRERATITAKKLQDASNEVLRRVNEDTNQSASDVPVDAYARRWAMAYFGISWPVVFILWIVLVSFLSYLIYKVMQWLYLMIIPAI